MARAVTGFITVLGKNINGVVLFNDVVPSKQLGTELPRLQLEGEEKKILVGFP